MRSRWVVTAAFVLAALLPAAPALAQANPVVAVSPSCGPVTENRETVTISGSNWADPGVDVYFDFQFLRTVQPINGSFSFTHTFNPSESRYYQITAQGNRTETSRTTSYSAPCRSPRVVLAPDCGPRAPSQVTVEAFDMPSGDVDVYFDRGGPDQVNDGGGFADDSGHVSPMTLDINPSADRTYVVEVNDYGTYGVRATAAYRVPCPPPTTTSTPSSTTTTEQEATTSTEREGDGDPDDGTTTVPTTTTTSTTIPPTSPGATLTVDPPLGRGGLVTRVRGTGFPAGPVQLTWLPGLGVGQAVAAPDGSFEARMLILPNDLLGPRNLVATGGATTATAPFLVVPDTMQPSGREVAEIVRVHRFLYR